MGQVLNNNTGVNPTWQFGDLNGGLGTSVGLGSTVASAVGGLFEGIFGSQSSDGELMRSVTAFANTVYSKIKQLYANNPAKMLTEIDKTYNYVLYLYTYHRGRASSSRVKNALDKALNNLKEMKKRIDAETAQLRASLTGNVVTETFDSGVDYPSLDTRNQPMRVTYTTYVGSRPVVTPIQTVGNPVQTVGTNPNNVPVFTTTSNGGNPNNGAVQNGVPNQNTSTGATADKQGFMQKYIVPIVVVVVGVIGLLIYKVFKK